MIYGDDTIFVHSITNHKIAPHPSTYAKGPAHVYKLKWEASDTSDYSWEPYLNVKRADCFEENYQKSDKFRLLILLNEYKKLSSSYASRFPKQIWTPKLILENGKECKVPQGLPKTSSLIICT